MSSAKNNGSQRLHFIKTLYQKNTLIVSSHLCLYWDKKSSYADMLFTFWYYQLSHKLLSGKWEIKSLNMLLRGRMCTHRQLLNI